MRNLGCIYCGGPTGSREHIFPAALGGRRKDKRILCGTCNETFSELDEAVANQLNIFNGLLGVYHDRKPGAPVRGRVRDINTGEDLLLDERGRADQAAPTILSEQTTDGMQDLVVRVSNEKQREQWLKKLRSQGKTVGPMTQSQVPRFFAQDASIAAGFGGEEAFRETGRIALNFLAFLDPVAARQPGLQSLKDFVCGRVTSDSFVGYDFGSDLSRMPPNAFEFGHRVELGSTQDGEIFARVSYFGAIILAVRLGPALNTQVPATVYDINPLARRAPDDLVKLSVAPELVSPPTHAKGEFAPSMLRAFDNIIGRIRRRHWETLSAEFISRINQTRSLGTNRRYHALLEILGDARQPMMNLISDTSRRLAARFRTNPDLEAMARLSEAFCAEDPAAPTGITEMTRGMLELVRMRFTERISDLVTERELGFEEWSRLMRGRDGEILVASEFQSQITEALDRLGLHGTKQ